MIYIGRCALPFNYTFIQQGHIKLIKGDKINAFLLNFLFIK